MLQSYYWEVSHEFWLVAKLKASVILYLQGTVHSVVNIYDAISG